MKRSIKNVSSLTKLCWAMFIFGVMVCVAIFVIATGNDKNSAEKGMKDVADYVKTQCIRYDEAVAETAAKDLVAVADSTAEIRDELPVVRVENVFRDMAEKKRLSGVVVWDKKKDEYKGYIPEGETLSGWATEMTVFSSAADNINKTYAERIFDGGYCYDYAIVGRTDAYGLVLGFTRRAIASVESSQLSVKTLLDGYRFEKRGKIVVTDGETVIAANDSALVGIKAENCPVVQKLRKTARYGTLERAEGERVYAIREKCKGYFIYVFMPDEEVFADRSRVSAYIAALYVVGVSAILGLRHKFLRTKAAEQVRKEEIYRKELDRLANEAIRANEAKTEFLRRMSHDVRTPINGIRGMVKIGDYYADDPEKQKECREKIWQSSGYLLELVNDVLEMTKLDAKDVPYRDENFSISDLINDITTVTSFQAGERGVTLSVKSENIIHDELYGAATLLKRSCTNLIVNAINYNKPGGNAEFVVREAGFDGKFADFEIICSDNGIGMSEEFKKVMFEPFAQEAPGSENRTGGVGLGLAIVKKSIEKMGGKIKVDSEKDKGTTFTITLFFPISGGASVKTEGKTENEKEPLAGYNALVVEDNELNLEIAEFMLETAGAKVRHAKNGEEAVSVFKSEKPNYFDFILMDVMMPVKDGIAATAEIRALKRSDAADVPIIAMTANAFYDDVDKVLESGMNGYVSKPLDARKLVKTILIILDNLGRGGGYLTDYEKYK